MDAPKLIARTVLVCLAAIAVVPRGQGLPTSGPGQTQQVSSYTSQTSAPVASIGATQASSQLVQPPQTATDSPIERAPRQASTSDKKKEVSNKKNKKSNKALIAECLAAHNKMRRMHNVPDLEWDEKLAAFAKKRSDHIAASDGKEFGHPPDLPFGENLFWHSSVDKGCEYMVKGWYDEIGLYNFAAPIFEPATGHFTQMVWKDTKKVGCAFTPSKGPRGGIYLTCNYDPPGNWVGEFVDNVPVPKGLAPAKPVKPAAPAAVAPITTAAPSSSIASITTARPDTTTTLASATAAPSPVDKQAETPTKPKSKKKKKKKTKGKKRPTGDADKKKDKKKKKGKKKRKKASSTTAAPPAASTSIAVAP